MSPLVYGRIYPEVESSELINYTLRVLIEPAVVQIHAKAMLELDTLRVYLRDLGSPCRIALLLPAKPDDPELGAAYEFMGKLEAETLPSSVVVAREAAASFPESVVDSRVLALASTAYLADADIVVSESMPTSEEIAAGWRKLSIKAVDVEGAKRICEVFAWGHDIPWSFRSPSWLMPWTPVLPDGRGRHPEVGRVQGPCDEEGSLTEHLPIASGSRERGPHSRSAGGMIPQPQFFTWWEISSISFVPAPSRWLLKRSQTRFTSTASSGLNHTV